MQGFRVQLVPAERLGLRGLWGAVGGGGGGGEPRAGIIYAQVCLCFIGILLL